MQQNLPKRAFFHSYSGFCLAAAAGLVLKMAAEQIISLKLMVDKEKNGVVFAESGGDFIDVLFSFLTMPMGTIIRLAANRSNLGSMDKLYESLKSLDEHLFNTEACKNMLLNPINAFEEEYQNLRVKIDNTRITKYYRCPIWDCCTRTNPFISTVLNTKCRCGLNMNVVVEKKKPKAVPDKREGVFVKGNGRYMITDDLQVTPISSSSSLVTMLSEGKVTHVTAFEERNVNVGTQEVLSILKLCLVSNTPLSDSLLLKRDPTDAIHLDSSNTASLKMEREGRSPRKEMSVKLFRSESTNKVLYAEGNEGFLDFLFSFLTFPLGSILHILDATSSLGCADNLYNSVKSLEAPHHIKSEKCKQMLLTPMLAPYFGSDHQLLSIGDQAAPWCATMPGCCKCFAESADPDSAGSCEHASGKWRSPYQLKPLNPKYADVVSESGGGFISGPAAFMVTDNMVLKPLSQIRIVNLLKELKLPITDLEECVVSIGEEEALNLLRAILTSKEPLTDVFSDKKPKPQRKIYYR